MSIDIATLIARAEITEVLTRYVRGADRNDWQLLRTCYHADATDDHGLYSGDLEGLITFLTALAATLRSTSHSSARPTSRSMAPRPESKRTASDGTSAPAPTMPRGPSPKACATSISSSVETTGGPSRAEWSCSTGSESSHPEDHRFLLLPGNAAPAAMPTHQRSSSPTERLDRSSRSSRGEALHWHRHLH